MGYIKLNKIHIVNFNLKVCHQVKHVDLVSANTGVLQLLELKTKLHSVSRVKEQFPPKGTHFFTLADMFCLVTAVFKQNVSPNYCSNYRGDYSTRLQVKPVQLHCMALHLLLLCVYVFVCLSVYLSFKQPHNPNQVVTTHLDSESIKAVYFRVRTSI